MRPTFIHVFTGLLLGVALAGLLNVPGQVVAHQESIPPVRPPQVVKPNEEPVVRVAPALERPPVTKEAPPAKPKVVVKRVVVRTHVPRPQSPPAASPAPAPNPAPAAKPKPQPSPPAPPPPPPPPPAAEPAPPKVVLADEADGKKPKKEKKAKKPKKPKKEKKEKKDKQDKGKGWDEEDDGGDEDGGDD